MRIVTRALVRLYFKSFISFITDGDDPPMQTDAYRLRHHSMLAMRALCLSSLSVESDLRLSVSSTLIL